MSKTVRSAAAQAGPAQASSTLASRIRARHENNDSETPAVESTDSESIYQADMRYNEIKKGDIHIAELQRMTMKELLHLAREENLNEVSGLKKQDLIFKILKD